MGLEKKQSAVLESFVAHSLARFTFALGSPSRSSVPQCSADFHIRLREHVRCRLIFFIAAASSPSEDFPCLPFLQLFGPARLSFNWIFDLVSDPGCCW
jgi:hypothetical protein